MKQIFFASLLAALFSGKALADSSESAPLFPAAPIGAFSRTMPFEAPLGFSGALYPLSRMDYGAFTLFPIDEEIKNPAPTPFSKVPEPSEWGMIAGGLWLLATLLRRTMRG